MNVKRHFAVAFASFDFFLRQLIAVRRTTHWAWLVLGYALFLWASLMWTGVHLDAPDNLTAACVYLASGLTLKMHRRTTDRSNPVVLGIVLGLGYLSKTVMFPVALVFLAVTVVTIVARPATARQLLAGPLAFALVAAPFIAALSISKGRLTFGDSGRLNYFWYINGHADKHWQGEPPGSGIPAHPTRQIFERPAVFEFATPVGGTSPTWYDPSYWHEGVALHVDARQELRAVSKNLYQYLKLFLGALMLGYGILIYASGEVRGSLERLRANWWIWLPAVAGLTVYMLAMDMSGGFVSSRLAAPFIVLLCAGVFSSVEVSSRRSTRALIALTAVALVVMGQGLFGDAYQNVRVVKTGAAPIDWQVAADLRRVGVKSGDSIAVIGDADRNAFWARLARVRIVAQVWRADDFWGADAATRDRALQAIRKTGAKVVVWETKTGLSAEVVPQTGWRKLEHSNGYVYFL